MRQLRLIDLLCLVVEKKLKDGQMVLIDNECYKFDAQEEKFYVPPYKCEYRAIYTNDLKLNCYILEGYKD